MDEEHKVDAAANLVSEVFACPPDIATQIVDTARFQALPVHTILINQGQQTRHVFMMVTGLARAMLASEQGVLVFIEEYAGGDIFGDLQLASGSRHDSEVIAATDLSLLLIDGVKLAGFGERHGCIGLALARILFARLRRSTLRIYESTALSASSRVYAELLRMGETSDNAISPPPVVADLALRVGTTRETASRCLSTLSRRGIIDRNDQELRIVAPARLADLAI